MECVNGNGFRHMKLKTPTTHKPPRKSKAVTNHAPRGYGAMRDVPLEIDPRIDLTKPIYEQVLELKKKDADQPR